MCKCAVPENIHGYDFPRGFNFIGLNKLKKCRKPTITGIFRGVGGLKKVPSVGVV